MDLLRGIDNFMSTPITGWGLLTFSLTVAMIQLIRDARGD